MRKMLKKVPRLGRGVRDAERERFPQNERTSIRFRRVKQDSDREGKSSNTASSPTTRLADGIV